MTRCLQYWLRCRHVGTVVNVPAGAVADETVLASAWAHVGEWDECFLIDKKDGIIEAWEYSTLSTKEGTCLEFRQPQEA